MVTIKNKWVEKEKKKRVPETAPAFESFDHDTWQPVDTETPVKRHTNAARASMRKTLRGIRR